MKSPLLCVLLLLAMLPQSFAQSRAKILDDNLEALKARLELIRNAEKEILFTTYIFSEDEISKYFLAELQLAVERGVSVKLIIDASNNYFKPKFLKYINRLGIETKLYNRFKGYNVGDFVKFRLHAKVLLVDYNQLIIGGRNIGGEYFGLEESNYQDRDIYIEGPSVTHLRSFFFNYFNSKNSEYVIQRRFWNCLNNKKLCERKELVVLEELFAAKLSIDSSLLARRLEDCNWKRDLLLIDTLNFYFDNSTLKKKENDLLSNAFFQAMESSKERLYIESPYLVLFDELFETINERPNKHVKLKVLTNSLTSTDGMLAHSGYDSDKSQILNLGAELFEFNGEDKLHSKSLISDDMSLIGSINLDPRSFYFNKEIFVIIKDKAFAEELMKSIQNDLNMSVKITSSERIKGKRNIFKRMSVGFLQMFVTPRIKNLL